MVYTRPYIAHAVGFLTKYMSKPRKEHSTIVKIVFGYFCGATYYAICYQGRPRPDKVKLYRVLLMQTRLEILIIQYIQVVLCLTYLEEKSNG